MTLDDQVRQLLDEGLAITSSDDAARTIIDAVMLDVQSSQVPAKPRHVGTQSWNQLIRFHRDQCREHATLYAKFGLTTWLDTSRINLDDPNFLHLRSVHADNDWTQENGATEYIVRSHDPALRLEDVEQHPRVRGFMKAGQALVFRANVWHRGGVDTGGHITMKHHHTRQGYFMSHVGLLREQFRGQQPR